MWITRLERSQQPCSAVVNPLEIANYGPITVLRQSHTPFTHHTRFGANFPSTAAEVSLENLLWDFRMRDFGAGAPWGRA